MRFQIAEMPLRSEVFVDYKKNGVIPKFLGFKLANRHLNNSYVYRKCQLRLLEEEIKSSERGLILWKMIHRGLRNFLKEHFLY